MDGTTDLAFERLYRRHRDELYRWLVRETGDPEVAEDVLQTAFLHAYGALLTGEPPREPRSWLYAIARNANRGRFRPRRVPESELDDDLPVLRDETLVPQLRDALATLPVNQRAAIVLREVAGLSYAEIGERLDVTVGAVQMLVFRARRRLRAELSGERRGVRLLLPLQPLLNALGRLTGAGDRALLLRGAAGVAGALALGGGVLATSGDATGPARAAAVTALAPAGQAAGQPARGAVTGTTHAARRSAAQTNAAGTRVAARAPAAPDADAPREAPASDTDAAPPVPAADAPAAAPPAAVRVPAVSEVATAPPTLSTAVSATVSTTAAGVSTLVDETVISVDETVGTISTVEAAVPQVPVPEAPVPVPQLPVPVPQVPASAPALPSTPLATP